MNTKRYLLASAAVFLFIFIYEWILHGVLLKGYYLQQPNLWRGPNDCVFPAMISAQIIFPLIFTYIFIQGYESKGLSEGLRYGLLIGLLFVPHSLIWYAVQPLSVNLVIAWIIGGIIEMMLAGAIVAAIYKKCGSCGCGHKH